MHLPSPLQAAVDANLAAIAQGIALLASLNEALYRARIPTCFNACIGGHIRHIIDHYQAFLRGLESGEIDYEARTRDPSLEADPAHARAVFQGVAERLSSSLTRERSVGYVAETVETVASPTSPLRELEFLLSHTIHHYALVAVMARLQGFEPEPSFGIAPSTLAFQRTQSPALACAR